MSLFSRFFFLRNVFVSSSNINFFLTFRWPLDKQSLFGYFTAAVFQTFAAFYICLVVSTILSLFVALCWILSSILEDIQNDLPLLNEREPILLNGRKILLFNHFCGIVEHYSNVKQLSEFCEMCAFTSNLS